MNKVLRFAFAISLVGALFWSAPSYSSGDNPPQCQAFMCLSGLFQKTPLGGTPSVMAGQGRKEGWGGGLKCNIGATDYVMHLCGYIEIVDDDGNCLYWAWSEGQQVYGCRYPYVHSCPMSTGASRDDTHLSPPSPDPTKNGPYWEWADYFRDSVYAHDQCSWYWTSSGHYPDMARDGYCCPSTLSCGVGASCIYRP